mgnify:CR=1 FL=1
MRVIAGDARGRRLEALPGTDITRPTLDQVKEAMFSIVQFDLPGARVLDLYAGSGQLGIEALSRGAARCVFLDENREAVNIVMKNCKTCGVFGYSEASLKEIGMYHMMKESAVEKAKERAVTKLKKAYPGSRLQIWRNVHRMIRRPILPAKDDRALRRSFTTSTLRNQESGRS